MQWNSAAQTCTNSFQPNGAIGIGILASLLGVHTSCIKVPLFLSNKIVVVWKSANFVESLLTDARKENISINVSHCYKALFEYCGYSVYSLAEPSMTRSAESPTCYTPWL